jgi:opacity protein-like surface antigen
MNGLAHVTAIATVLGVVCGHAQAQESADADTDLTLDGPSTEGWVIHAQPYVWIPASIEADSTVAGATAEIDLSFSDVIDDFDKIFALTGRLEAWRGDFGFIFDGMYVSVEGDFDVQPFPPAPKQEGIDVDVAQSIVDIGMGWRALDERLGDDAEGPRLRVELLWGGRFQYLKQEIDLDDGPKLGESEEWFELMIGGRVVLELSEKIHVGVRADASGFEIGSGSDLTWNFYAGVDIIFSPTFDLKLGYRYFDMDYSTGRDMYEFGLVSTMHGPYIGASFRF